MSLRSKLPTKELDDSTSSEVIILGDEDSTDDEDVIVCSPAGLGSTAISSQSAARIKSTNEQVGKAANEFTPFHLYRMTTTTSAAASKSNFQTNNGGTTTKYFRTLRQMIGFDDDRSIRKDKRKYQWLAIFNFLVDFSYLLEKLPEIFQFHRVIVFYGNSIGTGNIEEDEAIMNRWRQYLSGTGNTVEFIRLVPSDPPRSKTNPLSMKIPYGVHHTKMFLMGYHDEAEHRAMCRVVVHTANLLEGDIEYKTQGAYCQEFPLKKSNVDDGKQQRNHDNTVHQVVNPYKKPRMEKGGERKSNNAWPFDDEEENCPFEEDLITYLESYLYRTRQSWCNASSSRPVSASSTNNGFLSDTPMSWLQLIRQYDYSTAYAILIPSVPGRHKRNVYDNFGYLKLRQAIIQSTTFNQRHQSQHNDKRTAQTPAPIICQISSIGSLNEKWLDQFLSAIDSPTTQVLDPIREVSTGGKSKRVEDNRMPLSSRLKIIWPTMEEIRTSIEGYRGGNVSWLVLYFQR